MLFIGGDSAKLLVIDRLGRTFRLCVARRSREKRAKTQVPEASAIRTTACGKQRFNTVMGQFCSSDSSSRLG